MKAKIRVLLCVVVLAMAFAPSKSLADYQPPELALAKLEGIVTLTSQQKKQAYEIYRDLKDVMDDIDPAERPVKGAQSRMDAMGAIRAILTPEQKVVFDRTPQRLGGGLKSDPVMMALNQKIRVFVTNAVKASPQITAQVGTVQRVLSVPTGSETRSSGERLDPVAHPECGSNVVNVIGSTGKVRYKISWTMSEAGDLALAGVEKVDK